MDANSTNGKLPYWRVRVFMGVSMLLVNIKLKEMEE